MLLVVINNNLALLLIGCGLKSVLLVCDLSQVDLDCIYLTRSTKPFSEVRVLACKTSYSL